MSLNNKNAKTIFTLKNCTYTVTRNEPNTLTNKN